MSKAPAQIIDRERNNKVDYEQKIEKLKQNLALLENNQNILVELEEQNSSFSKSKKSLALLNYCI